MTDLHTVEIAAVLRQLTARLIASDDLEEALEDLVETAADLVEGASWCAVTLVRSGGPTTAAASPGLPESLVDGQYERGSGPALEAIRTRDLILVDDLAAETRWPLWRSRALAAGVRGVLTVPVDIDEHVIGALTVYAAEAGRFTADVGLTAMLVAERAGLLRPAVRERARARRGKLSRFDPGSHRADGRQHASGQSGDPPARWGRRLRTSNPSPPACRAERLSMPSRTVSRPEPGP